MKNIFGRENYHFKEGESRPNIEKILKTLNENGFLELTFNFSDWRNNTDNIIQQLKKYNSELLNDKYLDKPIEFIFGLKSKISDKVETGSLDNIIDILINNGITDENKKIKRIFRYYSLYEVLNKTLSDAISKNIHLPDANIELVGESNILELYGKIYDLYRKIERLNEYFNNDFKEYLRIGNNDIKNNKIEEFEKIIKAKDVIEKLDLIQDIIISGMQVNENRNISSRFERLFYEVYRILDLKNRHPNFLKNIKLKDELQKIIDSINSELNLINDEELQKILTTIEVSTEIKFNLYLSEFIPAFISRIDIIEDPESSKNEFIDAFEKRKRKKDLLSLGYLFLSILMFGAVIIVNYQTYIDNIGIIKTLDEFIMNFLGHNIYLFSIEILFLILAFYFLGLFKTYSKVVELYDSHILLIESDFYYRNDKDLNNSGVYTFELRKENTQKIHSLPDRSFEMLNGKYEIKTELPSSKILDKIGEILDKILSGVKK